MVVMVLLFACSLFAVAALISSDQALADDTSAPPSASASPMPSGEAAQTPTPTPTPAETTTPAPTPTPTIDPTAVILDIAKYKGKALAKERKAKKVRTELVKRAKALGRQAPKTLSRSHFDTWKDRFKYYKNQLKKYRERNRTYWKWISSPGGSGVNRWIPMLNYCGMPGNQMWHALKVMERESHGDPNAKNKKSTAKGLFQFLADWWRNKKTGKIKWNPFNPHQNVLHFVRAIMVPGGWSHWSETA